MKLVEYLIEQKIQVNDILIGTGDDYEQNNYKTLEYIIISKTGRLKDDTACIEMKCIKSDVPGELGMIQTLNTYIDYDSNAFKLVKCKPCITPLSKTMNAIYVSIKKEIIKDGKSDKKTRIKSTHT